MIKLCYKEYDFKMSLGAMKQFKQATGKDLWCSLLLFLESFYAHKGGSTLSLCTRLYEVMDFETASHVFHSLINASGDKVTLQELEDAMFRVGWLPSVRDDDFGEPWPIVMVALANECDKQLKAQEAKKP
jgi:hypothetical protein